MHYFVRLFFGIYFFGIVIYIYTYILKLIVNSLIYFFIIYRYKYIFIYIHMIKNNIYLSKTIVSHNIIKIKIYMQKYY